MRGFRKDFGADNSSTCCFLSPDSTPRDSEWFSIVENILNDSPKSRRFWMILQSCFTSVWFRAYFSRGHILFLVDKIETNISKENNVFSKTRTQHKCGFWPNVSYNELKVLKYEKTSITSFIPITPAFGVKCCSRQPYLASHTCQCRPRTFWSSPKKLVTLVLRLGNDNHRASSQVRINK